MEFSWMAGGRDKLEGWRRLNKAVSAPGTTSWKQIVYFWAFWVCRVLLFFILHLSHVHCTGSMIGAEPSLLFGQRQRVCIFLSWAPLKRYSVLYQCKILKNVGSKSKRCGSNVRTFVTYLCYIVFRIVMYQTQSLKYARDKLAVWRWLNKVRYA